MAVLNKKILGVIITLTIFLTFQPVSAGWLDVIGNVGKIGGNLLGGGGSDVIVTSGEDVVARALDQIKLGEKIAAKTAEMESQVNRVFFRIRAYQTMQGALWFNLGRSYYDLRQDLLALATQENFGPREFARQTGAKRVSQMRLLNQIEIQGASDLVKSAETIEVNNRTNHDLRLSVNEIISHNSFLACGFAKQINCQNQSLDRMLNAYGARVGELYLILDGAERSFSKISSELGAAEKDMGEAIKKYNEQAGLVAAEATKHIGILALHSAKLSSLLKHDRGLIQNIQLGAQVANLLKRITKLSSTLKQFNETRTRFADQANVIRKAGAQAREEIAASGLTTRTLREKISSAWQSQIDEIEETASREKLKIVNLRREMAEIERSNRHQAGNLYARLHDEARNKADQAFGKPVF